MQPEEHAAAWDARDRLLNELKQEKQLPVRALYIRRDDGGTLAIGLLPERGGVVMTQWNGASYTTARLNRPALVLEPFEQKAEGFGGVFGFGEKGSSGWILRLLDGGAEMAEAKLLPYITSFADLLAKDDRFLYGKRKPRSIPHWQLRPEERRVCEAAVGLWERLVKESV
ncbi:MAG: hypothetical protein VB062_03920 [Christensenella sp.]|nr:hypothetical protein [Christensenella sp.]